MEFWILGPLEVRRQGQPVLLSGGRQRALLAALVLHRNEIVSADRLVEEIWNGEPPTTGAKALHVQVSALRKALGEDGLIETQGRGYRLTVADGEVDVDQFEALLAEGRRVIGSDPAEAAALLSRALALWRGPALADLAYEPLALAEISRLEERRLFCLEERIEADLVLGRHADLVGELEHLVAQDPLRERFRAQLMLALYRSGRHADALDCYRQGRRLLVEELGIDPSPRLQELEKAILRQDPMLDAPMPATDVSDAHPSARAQRARTSPMTEWIHRRPRVVLLLGVLLVVGAAAAAAVQLTRDSAPRGIASVAPNSVGVIDPATNEIVAQVPVGRNPTSVAVGEGAVWVLNADDRTISRIDPETKEVREFATGTEPLDIAAGEGAVWVLNADDPDAGAAPTRTVSRIDPDSEAALTIELPAGDRFEPSRFPGEQLLLVGEGAVFAIGSDGSVARIDPRTNEVVATIDPGVLPGSIALEDGALWVSEKVGNQLVKVDLRTGEVVGTFEVGTIFVSGIAVGGGVLWATDPIAGTVWRIEPDGISETIDVGEGASAIAFGEDSTWVVSPRQGLIRRVDPGTNSDVETIPVGSTPQAVAVGADAIWVAVAESAEDPAADVEGSATPLPESFCGELIYEGDAAGPQYLIVSDLPLRGDLAASSRSIEAVIELVLRKRAFQAGPYRVGYQSCDDSSARETFDLNKCTANARAYAANQHILGVVGPANSDCALNEIPIANRADLAMVSPQNSATWLTSDDKSDSPPILDRLYPTGKRTYLRVMPNDRAQGAAHALLAAELGAESVYILGDDDRLRVPFRRAARRVGVAIAGESIWDQDATSYTDLAERIARSGADMVFIAGFLEGAKEGQLLRDLRARLGDDFPITTGDGWWPDGALQVAGDAAIGLLVSTHGTPNEELPAPGKALVGELASTLPDGVVPSFSAVYGAQAAELLLDAIARSNGTRASVVDQLFASRIVDGLIGDLRFDTNGDPTLQTVTFLRVVGEGGAQATDPIAEASVVDRVITIQPEHIRE